MLSVTFTYVLCGLFADVARWTEQLLIAGNAVRLIVVGLEVGLIEAGVAVATREALRVEDLAHRSQQLIIS